VFRVNTASPLIRRSRGKQEKGLQVRERIVVAASRLFYQRGYNQTSFSDIADAARIRRGSFYYHFKSKDEILDAVINWRVETLGAMLEDWQRDIPEPRERLKRYAQIAVNEAQDVLRYGCPTGSLSMELAKSRLALQVRAAQVFDLFLDWLQRQFAALGKGGASHDLALQLLAEVQGVALIGSVYKDATFLKREARRLANWLDEL
jgi:AcrR family transcriptional regulator